MAAHILGTFTSPMEIANDWQSFLYIIPLSIVLSVVYKTTKIEPFSWLLLARESAVLTASILVFMVIVAVSIQAVCALLLR
jgi:hypothetical protein